MAGSRIIHLISSTRLESVCANAIRYLFPDEICEIIRTSKRIAFFFPPNNKKEPSNLKRQTVSTAVFVASLTMFPATFTDNVSCEYMLPNYFPKFSTYL